MLRETGIYHLGSSADQDDIPFNEHTIDAHPFHPEQKGWPTRNAKKEERRMRAERELIRRDAIRGVGDVVGERIKRMRGLNQPQKDLQDGGIVDSGERETQRRQERAVRRRDEGNRAREKRRRILGG